MSERGGLVFREARLADGSGAGTRLVDVVTSGDRVVAVTAPGKADVQGERIIEAGGQVLAPGFVDSHTHDDFAVLETPDMVAKLSQGVTTVIVGNCGISLAPLSLNGDPPEPINLLGERDAFRFSTFAGYARAVEANPPAVNVGALIGHGSLRVDAVADISKPATGRELEVMSRKLADGLDHGAIGFSTGLFYAPNKAADMAEVVALARLAGRAGGVYATHMRDEHDGVLDSIAETVEAGRLAGVRVVISHHKCAGRANWGRSEQTLAAIAAAQEVQPVGLDAYPYAAGSTILQPDLVEPGVSILVTWSARFPNAAGKTLDAVAAEWRCDRVEAAARLSPAGAIYFSTDEADVRRILAFPTTMIGSDGLPRDVHPHPRLWGTFARVAGHYVRDVGLFSLEQAVHKMTGLPAKMYGLQDRGVVREGAFADLVLFDPETIADRATFDQPTLPADGIEMVVVNGTIAYDNNEVRNRCGRMLRPVR